MRKIQKEKMTILAIDDSETNLFLVESILSDYPELEIVRLNDSRKALQFVTQYKPDLILLDLMMPYFDGFQVLNDLFNENHIPKIPVIVLSAKADHETRQKVEQAGHVFLLKPVEMDRLVSELKKYFKQTVKKNNV
jgi:CheY-like chemotaxis protein